MYDLVLFDADGTLIDTKPALVNTIKKCIEKNNSPHFADEEIFKFIGCPTTGILRSIHIKEEDLDEYMDYFYEVYEKESVINRCFDKITDMLMELNQKNVPIGVITSKTDEEYEKDFVGLGLDKYFMDHVCSSDVKNPKPHADSLYCFLEKTGMQAKRILYVGDSMFDYDFAKNAKIDFALAGWGATQEIKTDHILNDPSDIFDLLSK